MDLPFAFVSQKVLQQLPRKYTCMPQQVSLSFSVGGQPCHYWCYCWQ